MCLWTLFAVAISTGLGYWLYILYLHDPVRGLPYQDSFARGDASGWKAFDGTWEIIGGKIRNNSNERGAKLVGGSRYWRNYTFSADVMLRGENGDAGLVVRTNHEEQGVDAYDGYYVGLRTIDQSLVLGRAGYGWQEFHPIPMPGGIHAFTWYHLKVTVDGCSIAAQAKAIATGEGTSIQVKDADCIPSGRVGLRSYSAGGEWRDLLVQPVGLAKYSFLSHFSFLSRLASVFRTKDTAQPGVKSILTPADRSYRNEPTDAMLPAGSADLRSPTQTIRSLRLVSQIKPRLATVRGVVTLTTPALYVQDATGGISVQPKSASQLKLGDEIEVTGQVHLREFSTSLTDADIRLLWTGVPLTPVSVTSDQAATGAFDASFIELQGILASKETNRASSVVLHLDQGGQSFDALLNPDQGSFLSQHLQDGSLLRLRGICTVDPAYTHDRVPFVLLLRSSEDVHVLAGAPWWNMFHIISLVAGVLGLLVAAQFFYLRMVHWRMHAVMAERERLAHEMHDTMAQSFAGIAFQLEAIRNGLPLDNQLAHQQLKLASEMVQHSHEEARRSIATLRPETLNSIGLLSALRACACRMVEGSSVEIEARSAGEPCEIPLRVKDTFFRIGQEAIANAVHHAKSGRISLRLEYGRSTVQLEIEDNGLGFTPTMGHPGFGILGMRKRAEDIAASLNIASTPGNGTKIVVRASVPPRRPWSVWFEQFRNHAERGAL
jgi:signal transduction histidine kinase